MASHKQTNDMEHVWKDISETWGRLTGEDEKSDTAFALTREIDAAGQFSDDIVDRIYARYEFCEGFTNLQLEKMKSLALSTKGSLSDAPLELARLRESLVARDARERPLKKRKVVNPDKNGGEDFIWRNFSSGTKSTWPDQKQNVIFGPNFSFPFSAEFKEGKWHRQNSKAEIEGVTKYMRINPPEDWG